MAKKHHLKYPVVFYDKKHIEPREYRPITYPRVTPGAYLVSNYGEIYSTFTNRNLSPYQDKDGHLRVTLRTIDGKMVHFSIHRLVAHEFLEPDPRPDATIINHKNGTPYYNYYKNLEYCTDLENKEHAKQTGLMVKGEGCHTNRFSEEFVRSICSMFEIGMTPKEVRNFIENNGYKDEDKSLYSLVYNLYNKRAWDHITNEYNF